MKDTTIPLHITCPSCQSKLNVPDRLFGSDKVLKCPKCLGQVDIRNPASQAAKFDDEPVSKQSRNDIETQSGTNARSTEDGDSVDVDRPKSKWRSRNDDYDVDDEPRSKTRSRNDDYDNDEPRSKRRSRDDYEPETRNRKQHDDHDDDNEWETRRADSKYGRFSTGRTIPATVQWAGILWIILGSLFLISVVAEVALLPLRGEGQGAEAKSSPATSLGLIMGVGFLVAGVRIRQGKSPDPLIASIFSILAGAMYTGIGIMMLGMRRGPAALVELLHLFAMISLFLGGLLVLAGVLALVGRSQYKGWFAAQRRSRRDDDYSRPRRRRDYEDDEDRDDDYDDEDRPRRRRSKRDDW